MVHLNDGTRPLADVVNGNACLEHLGFGLGRYFSKVLMVRDGLSYVLIFIDIDIIAETRLLGCCRFGLFPAGFVGV